VVVVADDVASGTEVQKFLQDFGFTNVRLYLDGIKKWEEIGGSVEYPKGISKKGFVNQSVVTIFGLHNVKNSNKFNDLFF
jgi:hypothetical protein